MRGQRFRFRRQVGRAVSFVTAMLAVLMLVAGGASHELLHADEHEGLSVQAVASVAVADHAKVALAKANVGAKGAGHTAPFHSCSGHCAAHTADQPPLVLLVSAPIAMTAKWRLDRGQPEHRHPSSGPERPPRA